MTSKRDVILTYSNWQVSKFHASLRHLQMELMNEIQYSTVKRKQVNVRKSLKFRDSRMCLNDGHFFFKFSLSEIPAGQSKTKFWKEKHIYLSVCYKKVNHYGLDTVFSNVARKIISHRVKNGERNYKEQMSLSNTFFTRWKVKFSMEHHVTNSKAWVVVQPHEFLTLAPAGFITSKRAFCVYWLRGWVVPEPAWSLDKFISVSCRGPNTPIPRSSGPYSSHYTFLAILVPACMESKGTVSIWLRSWCLWMLTGVLT